MHSPFTTAFIPGTRFDDARGGKVEMTTRIIGELKVPTGKIFVADPFTTAFDDPGGPLARVAPRGAFPVEAAIARFENGDLRIACARVRFGADDARASRWEAALFEGQAPPPSGEVSGYGVDAGMGCFFDQDARGVVDDSVTESWLAATEKNSISTWTWHTADINKANIVMFSSGWGDGFYSSYWGFNENNEIIELVTDFEVLIGGVSERFELPLPLSRGKIAHPLLEKNDVTARVPLLSRTTVILGGKGSARVELSDGTPVEMKWKAGGRHYTWRNAGPAAKLIVSVMVGVEPFGAARGDGVHGV